MATAFPSPGPAATRLPAICALALSAGALTAQDTGGPRQVRHISGTASTRVVIEVGEEAQSRYGRLDNPARIYIDLVDPRPARFKGLAYTIPVDDGVVRRIRVALREKETTRVVLDLDEEAGSYSVTRPEVPDRAIVVEVRRKGAPRELSRTEGSGRPAPKAFVLPRPHLAAAPEWIFSRGLPELAASRVVPAPGRLLSAEMRPPRPEAPVERRTAPAAETTARIPERTPTPAQRDRLGNRSLTRVLGLKLNRVVLDAGHGGYDTGTIGVTGLYEKDVVLEVSRRLGALLEERLGAKVVHTREDDTFVALERRPEIANEQRADLFLSIHANSSPYKSIAGTETFYLNFTSSRADLEVAARENAASELSIHDLSDVIRRIALRDKSDESRDFASRIQASAHEFAAQMNGSRIRNRGVKKAPFVVLIGAQMPAVLTEIGFLSNAREEALMRKTEYRQKVAEALYKGVLRYAQTLSHTRVAQRR